MNEIENHIMFSEMKMINKKEDLRDMINRVLKQGLEGLVLKDINVSWLLREEEFPVDNNVKLMSFIMSSNVLLILPIMFKQIILVRVCDY